MCIVSNMKAIQVSFDEALLEELDRTEEVRREGRSAVLRRAVVEYLRQKRRHTIAEQYAQAYRTGASLGKEFDGWEDQGRWPEE
jgi:metal-responsive CopG/Arc/MetJ family transcriptional regulator